MLGNMKKRRTPAVCPVVTRIFTRRVSASVRQIEESSQMLLMPQTHQIASYCSQVRANAQKAQQTKCSAECSAK